MKQLNDIEKAKIQNWLRNLVKFIGLMADIIIILAFAVLTLELIGFCIYNLLLAAYSLGWVPVVQRAEIYQGLMEFSADYSLWALNGYFANFCSMLATGGFFVLFSQHGMTYRRLEPVLKLWYKYLDRLMTEAVQNG